MTERIEASMMNLDFGKILPADALPPKRATFGGRISRRRRYQEGFLLKRGIWEKVWVARWREEVIGPEKPTQTYTTL